MQFAIIVNAIEKENKPTHKLLTELIKEVKEQGKLTIEINNMTINTIASNSKEIEKTITGKTRKANTFKQ